MKNQRLYNVFFPIWMLILFPQMWLVTIPANFAVDSLVILLGAHYLCRGRAKEIWKKSIFKAFIFGFLSDFLGSAFLFGGLYLAGFSESGIINGIFENTVNGPESIGGFFGLLAAVAISAVCIYFADYKISFKKLDIEDAQKKKLALIMAIATAPYTFFIPLYW
ncbi:MAG: hypothetical protein IJ306_07785 [Oscillospiraceae bacterium]|nr:hypothetical protein [Oscillospiraceae bacterium]